MLYAIETRLERAARKERRARFWTELGVCLGAALLVGGGLYAGGARGWLAVGVTLGIAGLGWYIVSGRQRRPIDLHRLALRIETQYPELEGRLLTALELQRGRAGLTYLESRVAREAMRHADERDWAEAVSGERLRLVQCASVVVLCMLLLVVWNLRPAPGRVGSGAASRSSVVSIEPGDVLLERGSSMTILATFPERDLPGTVEVVLISDSGGTNRLSLAKTLNDPIFGGSLQSVETNFVYFVEYGGTRSRDFKVTVFEHPRLERANAEIQFPAYTRLDGKRIENTRRVSAVEGSRVNFELLLNKEVRRAELVSKGGEQQVVPLSVATNYPLAKLGDFELRTSQTYELRLVDSDGRTNKVPELFVLEALQNRPPELRMTSPKGDVRPSSIEEISFAGSVWDDFGIEAFGIAYAVAGKEMEIVELGQQISTPEKRAFEHLLQLEDLELMPDQLVCYFLWADDIGPDGERRRSTGDLFFAEIRPYEEIFREASGGMEAESGQGQSGGQQGVESGKLAEMQKQIINATWNLQRAKGVAPRAGATGKEAKPEEQSRTQRVFSNLEVVYHQTTSGRLFGQTRRSAGGSADARRVPPAIQDFGKDLATVREAQEQLVSQAEQALSRTEDPRLSVLLRNVITSMRGAQSALQEAEKSPDLLADALTAQQSAYEALLKLQEHEYQVGRQQRGNQGQSGNSRQEQMRLQLDQMELAQTENRYETQRQAQRPQTSEQKEDLVAMNRLEELARRQQDINKQFKELQLALEQAQSEEEKEEVLRRLKKLQEDQQEVLNDMDELRQRMERPENQSRMAEQRQQLEKTREEAQRAAEAASQGAAGQALAAGTRAQRQLQDLRDELRNASSSQFAEEMREMRRAARELSQAQEQVVNRMEQQQQSPQRNLSSAPEREQIMEQLAEQRERLTNLVDRAMEMSRDAETSEPLLSRELYDSVRKFTQESAREVQQSQNQLLNSGMMTRSLLEQLKDPGTEQGAKLMDIATEMLKYDFMPQARDAAQRARAGIDEFRKGIEQAAESVLGSDTEALRLADQELEALTQQLEREVTAAQGGAGETNALSAASGGSTNAVPGMRSGVPGETEDSERPGGSEDAGEVAQLSQGEREEPNTSEENAGGQQGGSRAGAGEGGQRGERAEQAQTRGERDGGRPAQGPMRLSSAAGGGGEGGDVSGSLANTWRSFLEDRAQEGPLTGDDFSDWAERLRDVEEMIEIPELRNEVASARERAREMRQAFREERKKPDWAVVKLQLVEPLAEVRRGIREELARRESTENLVPIDRDPVPPRYSDLVRRYYENLGKEDGPTQ